MCKSVHMAARPQGAERVCKSCSAAAWAHHSSTLPLLLHCPAPPSLAPTSPPHPIPPLLSSRSPLHKLMQHTPSLFSRQALWGDAKEYVIKSRKRQKGMGAVFPSEPSAPPPPNHKEQQEYIFWRCFNHNHNVYKKEKWKTLQVIWCFFPPNMHIFISTVRLFLIRRFSKHPEHEKCRLYRVAFLSVRVNKLASSDD